MASQGVLLAPRAMETMTTSRSRSRADGFKVVLVFTTEDPAPTVGAPSVLTGP